MLIRAPRPFSHMAKGPGGLSAICQMGRAAFSKGGPSHMPHRHFSFPALVLIMFVFDFITFISPALASYAVLSVSYFCTSAFLYLKKYLLVHPASHFYSKLRIFSATMITPSFNFSTAHLFPFINQSSPVVVCRAAFYKNFQSVF